MVQFKFHHKVVPYLYVIIKYWDGDYIINEEHLYSNQEGMIPLKQNKHIQICIDSRSFFKDFKKNEVSPTMHLKIDQQRFQLLHVKLKYILNCYQIPIKKDIETNYVQYQKLMGVENYPITHYFILSIINQMYLELQEH